jgi:hypothetical protein
VINIVAAHLRFSPKATSDPIPKRPAGRASGPCELRVCGTRPVRWFLASLVSVLALTYGDLATAAELGVKADRGSYRTVRRAPLLMPACRETPYAVLLGCAAAVPADPAVDSALIASSRAMRAVGRGPYPTLVGR